MDLLQAIVLGLLQGITEWLPVSSQGQVTIAALALFRVAAETALNYAIFLHIGTLIAAIVYFRKEIMQLARLENKSLLKFLAIAVIATAVTAVPSYLIFRSVVQSAFALMLAVGILLIASGLAQLRRKAVSRARLTKKNALLLGLGQGFAVLPGVSRSGITTSVLLFEGFSPEQAFRLSFLLSVPSVFIAEILFSITEPISFEFNALIAVAIAAAAGLVSMHALIKFAERINFAAFCIGFGILYLTLAFL